MVVDDSAEVILTKKQREYLQGDFLPGSETTRAQSINNYDTRIRKKMKPAVYDLQKLFNHIEQSELEHSDAFGEGHEQTDSDPIPRTIQDHSFSGFLPDEYVDESGNPVDPDPEVNPDATHQLGKMLKELKGPNKADPHTQEALIDAVAFLCRAAEAGELKIPDVLERGFEKYLYERSERQPNESEQIAKVTQRTVASVANSAEKKDRTGEELSPIEQKYLRQK
jgi:hypothetical protein